MQGLIVPTDKINSKEIIPTGEGDLDKNELFFAWFRGAN